MNDNVSDADFIRNPDAWPGETLCLKRRRKESEAGVGYDAFGVITDHREPVTVYLRGASPKNDFENAEVYPTIDAMLADGWMVD